MRNKSLKIKLSLSLPLLPFLQWIYPLKRLIFKKFHKFKQSSLLTENISFKCVCFKLLVHMVRIIFWLKQRWDSGNLCSSYHTVTDVLWDSGQILLPSVPLIPILKRWDHYSLGFLDSFGIFHRCSILWLIITVNIYTKINTDHIVMAKLSLGFVHYSDMRKWELFQMLI